MTATPALAAAALYVGLNALILLYLTVSVIRNRRSQSIVLSDGGDETMLRLIRGHANAAETMPMALGLIVVMALMGTPAWVVHLFGLALTIGRLTHAWHFLGEDRPLVARIVGMALTLSTIGLGALGVIGHALTGLTA